MKTITWLLGVSTLAMACSNAPGGPSSDSEVGKTQQKAQFADDTVINIVDPSLKTHGAKAVQPSLTVTADINPVTVEVFYVDAKTTDAGSTVGSVSLAQTISLAADQTARHMIDMSNPAFAGGYGCILLDSIGDSPSDVFQTYVQYGDSMFSTGGSVFTGGSYRIPYWDGTLKMVLAITNQSDFDFEVQLLNVGTTEFKAITIPVLSTYRFDSAAEGWTLGGTNSVQVFTTNGGVIALSGYMDRAMQRIRITPVKAAPFP